MSQNRILFATSLSVVAAAIRKCWQSMDKGGNYPSCTNILVESDIALIKRVILQHKHGSTAEHLGLIFSIDAEDQDLLEFFSTNRYSSVIDHGVLTNARVILETPWLCSHEVFKEKYLPVEWKFLLEEEV